MFSDDRNKVFLTFLCSELEAVTKLNKAFQSETADITKLHLDLSTYFYSLLQKVVLTNELRHYSISNLSSLDLSKLSIWIPPSAVHLGYSTHLLMDELKFPKSTIEVIKENCFGFLKALALQIKKRLPDNFAILKTVFARTLVTN